MFEPQISQSYSSHNQELNHLNHEYIYTVSSHENIIPITVNVIYYVLVLIYEYVRYICKKEILKKEIQPKSCL